ncbi:MAG TPA: isocitrate dehydrogenase (NAD(+)) [Acidobacteriota bacterium]|nr:isocitrate dehydrogenase (NAD(+)) [Acidobacteriota bacterium]
MYNITLIPGDGIGPEISESVRRIIDAVGVKVNWEICEAGATAQVKYGTVLPGDVLDSIIRNKVALKGPLTTPIGEGFQSINVTLRRTLNLYANVRPIQNIPGVNAKYENVDLIIVRENTEDLYSGLEHVVVPGVVESLKIITEMASTRIARYAFELARKQVRKKVVAIHKANIMKLSDGLFLESIRKVRREYPDIDYSEMIVDNCAMQMVLNPRQFDVMLLPNLYGDIISDLGAGLIGGLGLAPSGNIGEHAALFEAVHGSAPDIAGKNIANPTALLLSSTLMLRHIGELDAADRIFKALTNVFAEQKIYTPDLGGTATTHSFTDTIISAL